MALSNFDGKLYIDGHLLEIPVGSSTVTVDVSYAFDTQIVGIKVFTESGFLYGDYGTFTVHHPANDAELARFGNNCYFPTGLPQVEVFIQGEGSGVPAGLKYRVKLSAVDNNGRKAIIWLLLKR